MEIRAAHDFAKRKFDFGQLNLRQENKKVNSANGFSMLSAFTELVTPSNMLLLKPR